MNKGLDALEKIKPHLEIIDGEDGEMWGTGEYEEEEALNTIEKSLKVLEILKCLLFGKCRVYETSEKTTATTITKGDYYVVELEFNNKRFYIGKEEYDLLKEFLL